MAHRCIVDVRFNELDPYNHVNHAAYVTYFEVGRAEALRWCGVPLESLGDRGVQVYITSLEVNFKAPAIAGDRLVVETAQGGPKGRVRTSWSQRILRSEQVIATATVVGATVNTDGKLIRTPEWLSEALEKLSSEDVNPSTLP